MPKVRYSLMSLALPLFLLLGCTASRIERDQWLSPFRYTLPERHNIRTSAFSRSFPGTFDEAWEAALIVLSRSAIVADVKKDLGLIVYLTDLVNPYVVLMEEGSRGEVRVYFGSGDYSEPLDKKTSVAKADLAGEAEKFFGRLSVQLLAEKRWKLSATEALSSGGLTAS